MGDRLHRTQLLLEREQHQALAEIARQEGRSISDVVREMVREQLQQRHGAADEEPARRLAALERIRQHRDAILSERRGRPLDMDPADLINQLRDEQDERNSGIKIARR